MIERLHSATIEKEHRMDRPYEGKLAHLVREEPSLSFLEKFLSHFPDGEVFLVGGAVRDAILGCLNKDFDFVVRSIPRKKLEVWLKENGRVDLVGSRFGIYKFLPHGFETGQPIDIALPRIEHSTQDSLGGARDIETQSDESLPVETDLSRRDFTFNAMAFEVRTARMVDPFEGMKDLEKRLIRAVGEPEARFREDLSRLLRAIRFASQLGCEIEAETWKALCEKMPEITKKRVRNGKTEDVVPRDVIGKEFAKALKADPAKTVKLYEESGAIRSLLPFLQKILETESEAYVKPFQKKPLSLAATAALLLRGIPFTEMGASLSACGLSLQPRKEPTRIEAGDVGWIAMHLQEKKLPDPQSIRASEFEKTYFSDRGNALLEALAALQKTTFVKAVQDRMKEMQKRLGLAPGESFPPLLISGNDVVAQGIAPGPDVRFTLLDLRDAQLEGWVKTRTEALAYLKKISQKSRDQTS